MSKILTFLVIGFASGYFIGRRTTQFGINSAHEAMREKKEAAKRRVMGMFGGASEITNDQVQMMLGVSDATATNYLSELEAEGKIVQIGREGRSVRYKSNG